MVSDNVCAILANRVYNRAIENRGPIPDGWMEVPGFYVFDDGDGFSAGAYRNTATNEIVIAYTGTNAANDWTEANFPAGFGLPSDQVERAIQFYSDVAATYGNAVTFTGHSLGGGLASLMTAYFGQRAVVFDPVPFRKPKMLELMEGNIPKVYDDRAPGHHYPTIGISLMLLTRGAHCPRVSALACAADFQRSGYGKITRRSVHGDSIDTSTYS